MGPLRELLATDHRQALEFFFQRLKDVSGPQRRSPGAPLQRQRAGALRPGLHAGRRSSSRRRRTSAPSSIISSSTRRCAGQPDDGNRRRPVPGAGGILRRPDAPAAQHPLVCGARRRVFQPGGDAGTLAAARLGCSTAIARRFETWRQRHARLSRDLRDQPFLLVPPRPAGSAGR